MQNCSRPGLFTAFGVALLVTACAKPEPPTLTLRAMRVNAVSPAGITLGLELEVKNPNGFPLLARNVDGRLEVAGGAALGQAHAALSSPIPAKSTSVVTSTLEVPVTNLPALVPLALTTGRVQYTFHGTAELGGERLNVKLPFETRGEITQAALLQAGLRGLGQ